MKSLLLKGLDVYLKEHIIQVRFPRSKKDRIRKKWKRDSINYILKSPGSSAIIGENFLRSMGINI